MSLKSALIVFVALVMANIFGNKSISFNLYNTYYVCNGMQFLVAVITVFVGFMLIKNKIGKTKG